MLLKKARLAYYYAVGLAGLRRSDVILASFPKSGNTWVRFFFCNLAGVLAGESDPVHFKELDQIMPELGRTNLLLPWRIDSIPRVVKTHKPRWPVFGGCRAILLTRDPRDVMTSFYHFESGKKRPRTEGTFSEFLRHPRLGLPGWFEHTASWERAEKHRITYEALKEDDVAVFTALLAYLDLEVPEEVVREAAARSSFKTVRGLEEKRRHKPEKYKEGYRFTRSGKRGGWKELFNEEDLRYYAGLKARYSISAY